MNIKKDTGTFKHTDKGWVKVPEKNIIYKGIIVKPENPLYSVIGYYSKPNYEKV